MAPKAKAKAESPNPGTTQLPNPPHTPVIIRFPESLIDQHAASRAVVLSTKEIGSTTSQYKLQYRTFDTAQKPDKERASTTEAEHEWKEVEQMSHLPKGNRNDIWLITGLSAPYVEFRLKEPKPEADGTATQLGWVSGITEPVCTMVDPPKKPTCEVKARGDYHGVGVRLNFSCANRDLMLHAATQDGPWADYPGLSISKVQVKWRATKRAIIDGLKEPGPDIISPLCDGDWRLGPMIEVTPTTCPYDSKAEAWSHLCSEVPSGCIAKFSVRVSTAYRWSPWSDESDDVQIALPPPKPGQPRQTKGGEHMVGGPEVEIKTVTDNSIDLSWDQFILSSGMTFVQYRITVCQVRSIADDPDFSKGHVAAMLTCATGDESVSYQVRGLIPDSLYMFKVDARYPYVGEHGWSVPAMTSKPSRTLFPDRSCPYAPVALPADDVEILVRSDPALAEQFQDQMPPELPQLVLLIEKGHMEEYEIEYALNNPATVNDKDRAKVAQGQWEAPAAVIPLGIPNVDHLSADLSGKEKQGWMAVGVLFSDQEMVWNWNKEAILCRLRHKKPALVSPLLWAGSASEPLVPFLAPPSYCTGSMRYCCEEGIFRLLVRFYLGLAPPGNQVESLEVVRSVGRIASAKLDDPAPGDSKNKNQKSSANTTHVHKMGHRYATHWQVRYQKEGEDGWVSLRPQMLPPACPNIRDADQGPIPAWKSTTDSISPEQQAMLDKAALVWDAGDRFETYLRPSDGLEYGYKYTVELRIGTPARWSAWTALGSQGPINFHIPAPRSQEKHGKPEAMRINHFPDTTSAVLKVPPFMTEAEVSRLEYVVKATPLFEDDWKTVPKGQRKKTGGNTGGPLEGGAVIEKSTLVTQQAFRSDVQVVQQLIDKRLVQNLEEIPQILAVLAQETDAELESIYGEEMKLVELELTGLLPATKYSITVSARCLHISEVIEAPLGQSLNAMMETLPGAPPPAAPLALPVPAVAGVGASDRAVFLEFDDRSEYVLEYRAVMETGQAWFPHASVQAGSQKAGKWWSTQEGGEWAVVPLMHQVPSSAWPKGADGPKKGVACMVAELPSFQEGTSGQIIKANGELADVVEFRLRIAERSGGHPCRWVGSLASSVALCFAPPVQPPTTKRVFEDDSWHVDVSFFLYSRTKPPLTSVAKVHAEVSTEELGPDLCARGPSAEVQQKEACNSLAPPAEEEDTDAAVIPVGYGHKQATLMQCRYRMVGAIAPDLRSELLAGALSTAWVVLPERPLSPPVGKKGTEAQGDAHTLQLKSNDGLEIDGIYEVQIRVGSSYRWSAWSLASRQFEFAVDPPRPKDSEIPGQSLEITTISSSAVLCRWPEFEIAKGVSKVQYLIRAIPMCQSRNDHGAATVSVIHEVSDAGAGSSDRVQAAVANLLPATSYHFSVSARYPLIGSREWGDPTESRLPKLEDAVADWSAPPAPISLPRGGPRIFLQTENEAPVFHAADRGFLLAYPDTRAARGGVSYRIEYKHIGLPNVAAEDPADELHPVDYRTKWLTPLEAARVDLPPEKTRQLEAMCPWKVPLRLWRVRLPSVNVNDADDTLLYLLQNVKFRLTADEFSECPVTRWFSSETPSLCSAMGPPLAAGASVLTFDERIGLKVSFNLSAKYTMAALQAAKGDGLHDGFKDALKTLEPSHGAHTGGRPHGVLSQVPAGFGHSSATIFQIRCRHSPKPQSIPWSVWVDSHDCGLQEAIKVEGNDEQWVQGMSVQKYTTELALPSDLTLQYGSFYQVSVRISDGLCWSDWSEPSTPVKVFISPPSPVKPDVDTVTADISNDCNVRLKWPLLQAHGKNVQFIEYAFFIREVLADGTELCPRQQAALIQGRAHGVQPVKDKSKKSVRVAVAQSAEYHKEGDRELMSCEIRDLRKDVKYVFSLGARYPHIGLRTFEDVLHSQPISLRHNTARMPVPMQIMAPEARIRRFQGARLVLLKWRYETNGPEDVDGLGKSQESIEKEDEKKYELQALAEGADDSQWKLCKDVTKMRVDGITCWAVKDIPFTTLRGRFRLWDRDSGRFGRYSPFMLTFIEPVQKIGLQRSVAASAVSILLKSPLTASRGTQQFCNRYQIRIKAQKVDADWVELPVQMLWHRQNDHLSQGEDISVDSTGAVRSGLGADTEGADESPVILPQVPLASVGICGEVDRQRCLVSSLREEDGLDPGQSYFVGIRIGDIYRFSDWYDNLEHSISLSVPPPVLSPELGEEGPKLRATNMTGTSFTAVWPQFVPAVQNGIPLNTEVEHLLTVTPSAPKRCLGKDRAVEVLLPRSQWLIAASIPEGGSVKDCRELSTAVNGLEVNSQYELKLEVRYSRIGTRSWSEVLNTLVRTSKDENRFSVEVRATVPTVSGAMGEASTPASKKMETSRKVMNLPLEAGRRVEVDVRPQLEGNGTLPPLEKAPPLPLDSETSPIGSHVPPVTAGDFEEWAKRVQTEVDRVTGGTVSDALNATGSMSVGKGRSSSQPRKPDGFTSFWHRDPMESRPMMPAMPTMQPMHGTPTWHTGSQMDALESDITTRDIGRNELHPVEPPFSCPPPRPGGGQRFIRSPEDRVHYPRRTAR